LHAVKDFFIPHSGNDHKPKALRPKSLLVYLVIALLIKTAATGALFLIYPSPAEMTAVIASKMIELTNSSRLAAGVPPLNVNATLTKSAILKGQDMLKRGYFSHDTPDGRKPWQWISKTEYDYIYAGENLAMDFTSAEAIQAAFLKSPSHRKNILNPKYKDIGVAVVSGLMNGRQTDLLVVFFGTQREMVAATKQASAALPAEASTQPEAAQVQPESVSKVSVASQDLDEVPSPSDEKVQPSPVSTDIIAGDTLNQASEGIIVVSAEKQSSRSLVDLIIEYSNIIFIAFIIFIAISLVVNILVKIKVQHAPLILQSLVVIALISAMVLAKFHFAERIASQMMILG
jgi:uncharacterized protein YkwD